MHRPYLDSFSYRYAESQLENERLRRTIKELNTQVTNLKWYNSELKNEKTKTEISAADTARSLSTRINALELENTDIKSTSFVKERELGNSLKLLEAKNNDSQSRISNLEWLNAELKKEKTAKSAEVADLTLEKSRLSNEMYRAQKTVDQKQALINSLESRVNSLSSYSTDKSLALEQALREKAELDANRAAVQARYNTVESLLSQREREVVDLSKRKQALLEESIQQQQNIKTLRKEVTIKNAEVSITRSRADELANRNSSLLNSTIEATKKLEQKERESAKLAVSNTVLASERNRLSTQLRSTESLASSLREHNTDLQLKTLKKDRQLKQHETLFKSMARDRIVQLHDAKNSAIEAERNVELSRLDPISTDYTVVESTFNGLKSSTSPVGVHTAVDAAKSRLNASLNGSSFSDYYNNKFGSPSAAAQAEIDRDLKLYRMEQSLNDSLERLRRSLSPKKPY